MSEKICACKGIRSCLQCQSVSNTRINGFSDNNANNVIKKYIYCNKCENKAFLELFSDHCLHYFLIKQQIDSENNNYFVDISGVQVVYDVIDGNEEWQLSQHIDAIDWKRSQSGRRKQDFGPKVNFKKQKLNFENFCGLPHFNRQLLDRLKLTDGYNLRDFIAVEVCHLEYTSENGSHIEPHFDDFWLWGERLVTVNLLSDTVMTLVLPKNQSNSEFDFEISVDMPKRSLVILSGDARHKYHHSIKAEHIKSRRIAITYRELSEQFLENGDQYDSIGKELIKRANNDFS